jgi:hypothetical protein
MKKLKGFITYSTHFVVNSKGELIFLSMCPGFKSWTGEKILLHHPKQLIREGNVRKAIETLRNNY